MLTDCTLAWLGPHWKSWSCAAPWCIHSAHAHGIWSRWLSAETMTPSTCYVMLSLGTGQTRSNCVWQRHWAMWWLFMERPASASFLISWVQYRLISSKELMYKQQLHIFKFPFVQFKIRHVYTSLFLLYFSTTGYQFSSHQASLGSVSGDVETLEYLLTFPYPKFGYLFLKAHIYGKDANSELRKSLPLNS